MDKIIFISWLAIIFGVLIVQVIRARRKYRNADQYSEEEHKYFRGVMDDDILW